MYEEYFGFHKKPFSLMPDPEFLYLSPKHKKALTILQYGLMNQAGFTVVTGEIGAGKTTLIQHLLNTIRDECSVGVITNTHSAFGDLLTWVLAAFGVKKKFGDKSRRYQVLVDYLQQEASNGRRSVLIVDEAQNMDLQTLEELRLLSNINSGNEVMLQLVLVGQPELIDKLRSPQLIQFAQRISVEFHLTALDYNQTEKYISHRLLVAGSDADLFTPDARAAIYYFSGGVPRLINSISDMALVFTFADELKQVGVQTVIDVIEEKKNGGIMPISIQQNEDMERVRQMVLSVKSVDLASIM